MSIHDKIQRKRTELARLKIDAMALNDGSNPAVNSLVRQMQEWAADLEVVSLFAKTAEVYRQESESIRREIQALRVEAAQGFKERALTTTQLEAELGCSAARIRKLVRMGMPTAPKVGRENRYFLSECRDWIEAHRNLL